MNIKIVMFMAAAALVVLVPLGCSKTETKESAESSVITATRDVVNATGDVLRNAVSGINNAVYGK